MKETNISPMGTAVLALGFSFVAGWVSSQLCSRWKDESNKGDCSAENTAANEAFLCECGFDLTGKEQSHVEAHKLGRQHHVNLHRAGKPILVTAKVNEYRAAIATHVRPEDVVLEVGCAEGLTTQRLAQRAKIAIGIDQHDFLIQRGNERLRKSVAELGEDQWSNLHLHTADGFDTRALIKLVDSILGIESSPQKGPTKKKKKRRDKFDPRKHLTDEPPAQHEGKIDKIWLDVSGSRELRTVVQLMYVLESVFKPQMMVVKSDHLKRLVLRTYLPSSVIPGLTNESPSKAYVLC